MHRLAQAPVAAPHPLRRLVLPVAALLLVTIILLSRRGIEERRHRTAGDFDAEIQQLVLGLLDPPYVDASGLFSLVPPARWRKLTGTDAAGYNVVFLSPLGADISIIAIPAEDDSFSDLLRRIDRKEREMGIDMRLEISRFNGFKAVRRTASLHGARVLAIDFATAGVAHHIQFSAHPSVFEKYLPAVMDLLKTYIPRPAAAPREGA